MLTISFHSNHIGAVMVSILVSCVVGGWIEPRSCQTKDYTWYLLLIRQAPSRCKE